MGREAFSEGTDHRFRTNKPLREDFFVSSLQQLNIFFVVNLCFDDVTFVGSYSVWDEGKW